MPQPVILFLLRPLLLLLLLPLATATPVPFDVCSGTTDGLGVQSIELDPLPAVAGQDLRITVLGVSAVRVEEGSTVTMSIREGPLPAPSAMYDLCEALRATSDLSCPFQPGTAAVAVFVYRVPGVAPPGTASSRVVTHDVQGKQLSCISLTVPVVRETGMPMDVSLLGRARHDDD